MGHAADYDTRTINTGSWGKLQFETGRVTFASGDNIGAVANAFILPAGCRLLPALSYLQVVDAGTASTTFNVGIKSLEGTNQDDPDYFVALGAGAALGIVRGNNTGTVPIVTAQKMYVQIAVAGANQDEASIVEVGIAYIYVGNS